MDTNKIVVINQCFLITVSFVSRYSSFLAKNLEIIWNNYRKTLSKNQKNKYYRQFKECVDNILNKKNIDDKELKKLIILELGNKPTEYKNHIISCIKDKKFKEIEIFLIEECSKVQKDVVMMELPKKKMISNKKETNNRDYDYVTYNGEIYCHVISINNYPFKRFSKNSFFKENEKFTKSLDEKKYIIYTDLNSEEIKKLNINEKIRRIYVKDMYLLMLRIKRLEEKDMNITYPIEEYFKIAKMIADKLYIEVLEDNVIQKNKDKLNILTIQTYGPSVCLELYNNLESRFIENLNNIDKIIKEEYVNTSRLMIIEDKYTEYKFIRGIIPSKEDILRCLNKKIIDTVSINYKKYMNMMDRLDVTLGKYMNVEEYIMFYKEMKTIILNNSLNNKNVSRDLITIQKMFSSIIASKIRVNKEQVIKSFFKEDVIIT